MYALRTYIHTSRRAVEPITLRSRKTVVPGTRGIIIVQRSVHLNMMDDGIQEERRKRQKKKKLIHL